MKFFISLAWILVSIFPVYSETPEWKLEEGKVFFKSETELETILGEGSQVKGSLDISTKKIIIEIGLSDLKTPNRLQTSHMHENYLETHLYPVARFTGTVESIKDSGEVKAKGIFELHGKTKEDFVIIGNLEKKGNKIEQLSYFTINLSDFGIEIPKLLFLKLNKMIQLKVKLVWKI